MRNGDPFFCTFLPPTKSPPGTTRRPACGARRNWVPSPEPKMTNWPDGTRIASAMLRGALHGDSRHRNRDGTSGTAVACRRGSCTPRRSPTRTRYAAREGDRAPRRTPWPAGRSSGPRGRRRASRPTTTSPSPGSSCTGDPAPSSPSKCLGSECARDPRAGRPFRDKAVIDLASGVPRRRDPLSCGLALTTSGCAPFLPPACLSLLSRLRLSTMPELMTCASYNWRNVSCRR